MDFPVMIICTLQGSSVTQGNPVTFTAKTFAVQALNAPFQNKFFKGRACVSRGPKGAMEPPLFEALLVKTYTNDHSKIRP